MAYGIGCNWEWIGAEGWDEFEQWHPRSCHTQEDWSGAQAHVQPLIFRSIGRGWWGRIRGIAKQRRDISNDQKKRFFTGKDDSKQWADTGGSEELYPGEPPPAAIPTWTHRKVKHLLPRHFPVLSLLLFRMTTRVWSCSSLSRFDLNHLNEITTSSYRLDQLLSPRTLYLFRLLVLLQFGVVSFYLKCSITTKMDSAKNKTKSELFSNNLILNIAHRNGIIWPNLAQSVWSVVNEILTATVCEFSHQDFNWYSMMIPWKSLWFQSLTESEWQGFSKAHKGCYFCFLWNITVNYSC